MVRGQAVARLAALVLAASVLGICPPAAGQDPVLLEVALRDEPSPPVRGLSQAALSVDLGTINPLLGEPRAGEQILARDGSGVYVVFTVELTLSSVGPVGTQHWVPGGEGTSATRPVHGTRRPGTRRSGRDAGIAVERTRRGGHPAPAVATPPGWVEVILSLEQLPSSEVELRFMEGTGADWGASGRVGTPLRSSGAVVYSGPPDAVASPHQLALFVPRDASGPVSLRAIYEVSPR